MGTWGGEAEVVTASSKHPQQAAEFINWMNDSQQGLNLLIKNVSVFPAATFAQSSPELQTPPPFMSDQPGYNTLMASVAKGVRDFQIWGPDASVTFSSYSDAFASALQNHTSFTSALSTVQKRDRLRHEERRIPGHRIVSQRRPRRGGESPPRRGSLRPEPLRPDAR